MKKTFLVTLCLLLVLLPLAVSAGTQYLLPSQILLAPEPEASAGFGQSVANWGDEMVVGSHGSSSPTGQRNCGDVYYYQKVEGEWRFVQRLLAPVDRVGARFGFKVALSDRYLVVSSSEANFVAGERAGAVYIYEKGVDGLWETEPYEIRIEEMVDLSLSQSIALQGDILVLGSNLYRNEGVNVGVGLIYERNNEGAWLKKLKVLPDDGVAHHLGRFVALNDLKAVFTSMALGAIVYDRSGDEWLPTDTLSVGANFRPWSVALEGEFLLVGDKDDENGIVYIWRRDQLDRWELMQQIESPEGKTSFGSFISIHNGYALISCSNKSVVYCYALQEDVWNKIAKIIPAYHQSDSNHMGFGFSTSLNDAHGIVGSPSYKNEQGITSGAIYYYDLFALFDIDTGMGNEQREADTLRVYAYNGLLYVATTDSQQVMIHSVAGNGTTVLHTEPQTVSELALPRGAYVVTNGRDSLKIIL